MTSVEVSWVTFDCENPERLGDFWSRLLGIAITSRRGPCVFLARAATGLGLGFQQVEHPQAGKLRLHLDLTSDDLDRTVPLVLELGGRRAAGYDEGGFLVMVDPEGNEFCLLPPDGARLDEWGIALSDTAPVRSFGVFDRRSRLSFQTRRTRWSRPIWWNQR